MVKAFLLAFGLVFVLLLTVSGSLGAIGGLLGGLVGLVTGLIGAAVGLVVGMFGAVFGIAAGLFGALLPLLILALIVAGIVQLIKLI